MSRVPLGDDVRSQRGDLAAEEMNGVETANPTREALGTLVALVQLTKPAVTRLVVLTMLCGAAVAPGPIEVGRLLIAFVGTVIVVGAANALNMYLERESDAFMERTRGRPLPSGRLAPEVALWFGVVSAVVGLVILTVWVNSLTALLAAVALLTYALVYTPLKRVTPLALYVGAIPGALPPAMGWASMTGYIDVRALTLFAILFVWQLPHFCAIAIFRCDEYVRAGMRVMPGVNGVPATRRAIVRQQLLLFAVSLTPWLVGLARPVYAVVAAALSAVFLAVGLYGWRARSEVRWARTVFLVSMPYLVLIYGVLVPSAL